IHLHLRRTIGGVIGALGLLVAALLTKENAATFWAVVASYELFGVRGSWGPRIRRAVGFGALYLVPAAVFLFVVRPYMLSAPAIPVAFVHAPEGLDPQVGAGRTYVGNMLTQSRVQLRYLQLVLTPVRLNIDHAVPLAAPAGRVAA